MACRGGRRRAAFKSTSLDISLAQHAGCTRESQRGGHALEQRRPLLWRGNGCATPVNRSGEAFGRETYSVPISRECHSLEVDSNKRDIHALKSCRIPRDARVLDQPNRGRQVMVARDRLL